MLDVKNKITLDNTFETDKHNSYLGLIENDSAWITSCSVLRSCFQLLNLEFLKGISSSWRLTYDNTYFKYLSVLQVKSSICRCLYTGKTKLNYFFWRFFVHNKNSYKQCVTLHLILWLYFCRLCDPKLWSFWIPEFISISTIKQPSSDTDNPYWLEAGEGG